MFEDRIVDPIFESHGMATTLFFDLLEKAKRQGWVSVYDMLTHPNFKPRNYTPEDIWRTMDMAESRHYGWMYDHMCQTYMQMTHDNHTRLVLHRKFDKVGDIWNV